MNLGQKLSAEFLEAQCIRYAAQLAPMNQSDNSMHTPPSLRQPLSFIHSLTTPIGADDANKNRRCRNTENLQVNRMSKLSIDQNSDVTC